MHRTSHCILGFAFLALVLAGTTGGCSSHNTTQPLPQDGGGGDSGGGSCSSPPMLADSFTGCSSCTFSSSANPAACAAPRTVNACCAWVTPPTTELSRGTNLHYFSSSDPTVDLGCLTNPAPKGTPMMVTLNGYVKLFANGNDSAGVKIEIFQEGTGGALGPLVGTAQVTQMSDSYLMPKPTWSTKCPSDGCTLRRFTYPNVPTETPLIIKTSDANNAGYWADLYDYNVYIANSPLPGTGDPTCVDQMNNPAPPCYNPTTVASTDINAVSATVGVATISPGMGLLAGEVHDCGDVRLAGATVDTDQAHGLAMFYFNQDESDPLPDTQATATSPLGLFGTLNMAAGVPTRISATGIYHGQLTLIGTYTVQLFPGAVTALSLRGRRPFQ